jgi:hypothetical protein
MREPHDWFIGLVMSHFQLGIGTFCSRFVQSALQQGVDT